MTLLQLQYFVTLSRVLHYTRAAEELHISQPSLSYEISELEKSLGVKLFQRKSRSITLSAYGKAFLPYAEQSLALLEEGAERLNRLTAQTAKTVRLGYFHSIATSFVPALVDGFYSRSGMGDVRFQFTECSSHEVLTGIRTGEIEIGFSLHQADWADSTPVIRQPLYLAVPASHPLAERKAITFADFAHEPQVMLEADSNLRLFMDKLFAKKGILPNVAFEVRECNAALQYVSLGYGVSVLPPVPAMHSDKVRTLPISDDSDEFARAIYLTVHRTRPLSPTAQKLYDYIRENYAIE